LHRHGDLVVDLTLGLSVLRIRGVPPEIDILAQVVLGG
jgi:hypothetical protein